MKAKNPWGIPFLSGSEIRKSFIDFFVEKKGHQFVPSSPVVPHDDPTLLFINSGMNQFKSLFLGESTSDLKRAVNSQKCLRVSGKHNDLDEVGRDTYHHTFFEMLGNWSFGDYYKQEALTWSWELLTEVWKLPKNRLFVTVFKDDDEAESIWRSSTDIDPSRILRFGEKSNFWEMGEVGPCGPCSEIHFDMGDLANQASTFADPEQGVNGPNARYIEIWNNVFMQYERLKDGSLKPLKSKHVDTGMGFERICSIIQGTGSNYETDLFSPLIQKIVKLTGIPYETGAKGTPHRVIADHLRALAFAIGDGATPGNEGRGYVLRRILRRASRFSQDLNQKKPFIYQLVPTLVELMGHHFPELTQRQEFISAVIESEESRFMRTLKDGLLRFQKIAADIDQSGRKSIPGSDVFQLYDTFGFPVDLTEVLAGEKGLTIDQSGFASAMNEQKERARGAAKFTADLSADADWTILNNTQGTDFVGYETTEIQTKASRYREVGDEILVVLEKSPFYPESGGQVGDIGMITSLTPSAPLKLKVIDTFKIFETQIHRCLLENGIVNSKSLAHVHGVIDQKNRKAIVRHHSATHLLHAALRQVLGTHVTQQGSRVSAEGLRFDFTHPKPLSPSELEEIETLINVKILDNERALVKVSSIDEAKNEGALALFGEKYGETVRHIKMGGFSHELCGGTHVSATGEIGLLRIVSETSIASGIRRIEAVAGEKALSFVRGEHAILSSLAKHFKTHPSELQNKISETETKFKELEKKLKGFQKLQLKDLAQSLYSQRKILPNGLELVVASLGKEGLDRDLAPQLSELLAESHQHLVSALTLADAHSLGIFVSCGSEARKHKKAGELAKSLGECAGGKGGGRPDRAQAGSKSPEKEAEVLSVALGLLGV